jgi:hypothetical protein
MEIKLKSKNPYKNLERNLFKATSEIRDSSKLIEIIRKIHSKLDFSSPESWLYKHPSQKYLGESVHADSPISSNPYYELYIISKLAVKNSNLDRLFMTMAWLKVDTCLEDWLKYQ